MGESLLKPLKSAVGGLIAAVALLAIAWIFVGGPVKIFGPHLLGYEHIGWRHTGVRTVKTVSVPKWIGPDTLLSPAAAPFRQNKVYLEKGDAIVIEYDVSIEKGGLILSVFRTNLSLFFQGPLVESHQAWRLGEGAHQGAFEYVAPRNGYYKFSNQIRWEYDNDDVIPFPNYDLRYEYSWRVRHAPTQLATSAP